ncbi:LysM peptidoglycan-binding domain-containing protein [Clostridium tetani]|uniref:Conserved protein n=1 Tax=Clostridium tetani (strain Massachusetts / E88) TaxID=212717 RepID=Q89A10_CLOTE|nr:LysM peptidoglycan-binding domain-containing protein [Clostridium tetani]AAO37400.1 conserved protein [Clostridium tetani E88]KGI36650.1 hypothetical protein KY52_13070 [Clostridium tetani]KGI42919.1 hypothetical protein KY55_08365 [Clostridium tetani]KHO30809.1 hypothetical protein OR63_13585 [Clostridium tetani]KIG19857.1 hypothetical protein RS78_12690 [Clostridium tetani]
MQIIETNLQFKNINYGSLNPLNKTTPSNYIVKSYDALWSISKKFNTSVELLKKINNLNSDTIYPNQILKIHL